MQRDENNSRIFSTARHPILAILLLAAASLHAQTLWRAPRPFTIEDWTCGVEGCGAAPAPPFHFEKEDLSGTTPKLTVRDAKGRTWSVKFGAEVIPECFAPRFLGAIGYFAEHTYFVASGKVEEMPKLLHRARRVVKPDGTFARARFEPRGDKDMEFQNGKVWAWQDNPFRGTHELAGLKIVMMLLSNWDAKDARFGDDSNNAIFRTPQGEVYSMYDWGASMGRWGGALRRDQSDCAAFARDTPDFVRRGPDGSLVFAYQGKNSADIKDGITVADAQWLLPYLQRAKQEQIEAALRASGATARQSACWAASIEARIGELARASSR